MIALLSAPDARPDARSDDGPDGAVPVPVVGGLPFAGLTVLVTGTVEGLSRQGAQEAIVDLGGAAAAGVTGKVDLVVFGDGAGVSKEAKARALGIRVMRGEEFALLVADPTSWDGTAHGRTFAEHDALAPADETDDEPVDPEAHLPMSERHLVTQAVCHPVVGGKNVRQIRRSCQCGHRWLGERLDDYGHGCPVRNGTATLSTTRPWEHSQ